MNNTMIKVALRKPGMPTEIIEVENTLETFQTLVEGYVEQVNLSHWSKGMAMLINEEGKLHQFKPNFLMNGDMIMGNAVFVNLIDKNEDRDGEWHDIRIENITFLDSVFSAYDNREKG